MVVEKRRVGLASPALTVQMVMRMVVGERRERGCLGTDMVRYLKRSVRKNRNIVSKLR
jgi:hypothetical protein